MDKKKTDKFIPSLLEDKNTLLVRNGRYISPEEREKEAKIAALERELALEREARREAERRCDCNCDCDDCYSCNC